jgi:hypothetical protein
MAKLILEDIGTDSFQSIDRYNANMALIEAALEKTLSRDGTSPNTMSANLDMNSNRIINLPAPLNNADAANKAYVDEIVSNLLAGIAPGTLDYEAADAALLAQVRDEIAVVAADLTALATRVTVVEAQYDGLADDLDETNSVLTAAVTSEATARATADSALAARLDIVEASVESPNTALVALVNSHTTAIADLETNSATASSVTALTSRVTTAENDINAVESSISSEATTRATADSALTTRVTSLEASIGTPSGEFVARIEDVEEAIVDLNASKASASSVTALTATVAGNTSSITTTQSAVSTLQSAAAHYTIEVAAGGGDPAIVSLKAGASGSEISLASRILRLMNNTGGTTIEVMRAVGGLAFFKNPISCDISGRRLTIGPGFGVSGSQVVLWFGPDTLAPSAQSRTNGYWAFGTDGAVYYGSAPLGTGTVSSNAKIASGSGSLTTAGVWESFAIATMSNVPTGALLKPSFVDISGGSASGPNIGTFAWRIMEATQAAPNTKTLVSTGAFTQAVEYEPPSTYTVDITGVEQPSVPLVAATKSGNTQYTLELHKGSGSATLGYNTSFGIEWVAGG